MPRKSTIFNPKSTVSELFISLMKVGLVQALVMKHKVSFELICHMKVAFNEFEQGVRHTVLWPALPSSRKSSLAWRS